jgi:hypothetical protein
MPESVGLPQSVGLPESVGLDELCSVLRSKNAGPYLITLDLIFKDRRAYEAVRDGRLISRETIATAYGISEDDVAVLEYIDGLKAVKATYKRRHPAGSPGDTDCFGMAQEAPLLYIQLPRAAFQAVL